MFVVDKMSFCFFVCCWLFVSVVMVFLVVVVVECLFLWVIYFCMLEWFEEVFGYCVLVLVL